MLLDDHSWVFFGSDLINLNFLGKWFCWTIGEEIDLFGGKVFDEWFKLLIYGSFEDFCVSSMFPYSVKMESGKIRYRFCWIIEFKLHLFVFPVTLDEVKVVVNSLHSFKVKKSIAWRERTFHNCKNVPLYQP